MSEKAKKNIKLEIKMDDEIAQGVYTNFAAINHTDSEFTLDFIYVQPQVPQGKLRSRVITSPRHAKRLLAVLQENISRYEAAYGKIELTGPVSAPPAPDTDNEKFH